MATVHRLLAHVVSRHRLFFSAALALILLLAPALALGDEIELSDGRKFAGKLVSQDASHVVFNVVYPNGGMMERTFAAGDVKSIKKLPLPGPAQPAPAQPAAKPAQPAAPLAPAPKTPPPANTAAMGPDEGADAPEPDEEEEELANMATNASAAAGVPAAAGRADIDALIDSAGKTPPDWWDSVNLAFPNTMDLTWPQRPGGKWNPQRNINQYFISIINPKPALHKQGCKFMHHVLNINKDSKDVQARAMQMLGRIYGIYLHDYARGAFWYRKAAKAGAMNPNDTADLAFYYWKLGSREMALAELNRGGQYSGRTIRVLGSMGEVAAALQLAGQMARSYPDEGGLAGADVCRVNGRYAEADQWYQRVLSVPQPKDPKQMARWKRYNDRAKGGIEVAQALGQFDLAKAADGTYSGAGGGFRGPVTVQVAIKSGKIENVKIAQTKEDWPLNALVAVPAQIIEKQSLKGVDSVSGATCTAEAVLIGAGKALASARRK
jgi:uncharacterized protein with FMN-binding domain